MKAISDDLRYLVDESAYFSKQADNTMSEWVLHICQNPNTFKQNLALARVEKSMNDLSAWGKTGKMKDNYVSFDRDQCNYTCDSRQQLAIHLFRMHAVQRLMRQYIDTEYCLVCSQ